MRPDHHVRSSSHGRKLLPLHARPSKPPALKRGTSYTNANVHSIGAASSKSATAANRKSASELVVPSVDDGEDMASFIQFCTTCERQIINPQPSRLYCSEVCRRRDSNQSIVMPPPLSPHMTPSLSSYVDSPPPDIIPQRSPTILRPVSLTFSDLTISDHGSPSEHTSEYLDFVEASATSKPHVESWNSGSHGNTRPSYKRASTTTDISNMPSLSHTPSSSIGTIGSVVLQRPMPSRHNKSYSTNSTRSEDLVNPCANLATSSSFHPQDASLKSCASTVTAFRVAEAGALSYQKRPSTNRRFSSAHGSLKQLFSHEAMKAPPS
ncbi:hypothetical protein EJ03DRAFT_219862 [Teratosphaeria nubilosa]|uniref:Life-span regulatory factor-domain-containing protein n=1 Tax=Teratosphaeria nubilosa TaxID=161662 RepID=A0A6G1KWS9_9PEZI|nr:hypothetical protein EJ03DRAFT_219862 [Teratosphaeria nubilosa]